MNKVFFKKVYKNEPFKARRGIVYVDPDLAIEILDQLDQLELLRSKYEQALTNNEEFVIIVVNALSGTLALAAREKFPEARIICVEYFPFEINHLRKMEFEVVYLEMEVENFSIEYMNSKIQQKIQKNGIACVLGNPPYQNSTGKSTNNKTIWDKITFKSIDVLGDGGIISFITPQSWMRPNHPILNWFKSHTLLRVSTDIEEYFPGVGSTFCYWIATKTSRDESTPPTIMGSSAVNIANVQYLVPEIFLPIHNKLVFSHGGETFELLSDQVNAHTEKMTPSSKRFSDTLGKEKTPSRRFPIFHTNAQMLYSSLKTKNFDDKKVMFSDSGYFKPIYNSGGIGSSQRCHYFLVSSDEEGIALERVLRSKLYQFIVSTAKWSGFSDLRVLRSLPKVDLTRSWTDQELYEHFGIDKIPGAIELIEKTVK